LLTRAGTLKTPDAQQSTQHFESNSADIAGHDQSHTTIRNSSTVILYLVVFKNAKDPRVMSGLADFVDLIPESAAEVLQKNYDENENGYAYAWNASCAFIDCSALARKYGQERRVDARHELVAHLRAELKHHEAAH
jgi:hypothetical protein